MAGYHIKADLSGVVRMNCVQDVQYIGFADFEAAQPSLKATQVFGH